MARFTGGSDSPVDCHSLPLVSLRYLALRNLYQVGTVGTGNARPRTTYGRPYRFYRGWIHSVGADSIFARLHPGRANRAPTNFIPSPHIALRKGMEPLPYKSYLRSVLHGRDGHCPSASYSSSSNLLASARRSSGSKNSICRVPPLAEAITFTWRPKLSRRANSTSS